MFAEWGRPAGWQEIMPGVRFCGGLCGTPGTFFPEPGCLEIFFCTSGTLRLRPDAGACTQIRKQEFLILGPDASAEAEVTEPLEDCCCILAEQSGRTLAPLCRELGIGPVFSRSGCTRVESTLWSRSVFSILSCLPDEERGRYCFLKSLELLYLLEQKSRLLEQSVSPGWGYLAETVAAVRAYMEAHLDEKLTISAMSSRFHISPTAFKNCFRSMYGLPVHRWLQQTRLERAADLLSSSPMTVLQAAQEVGYESVGQFHVAFRQQYGMTPNQYRKMSETKEI